jgi:hypothetical protein
MGESFGLSERGADEAMLASVASANVACGFHAGDPSVMWRTLERAKQQGGRRRRPSRPSDLLRFGRRRIDVAPSDARDHVLYHLGAFATFCRAVRLELHHVKLHGAFYMMALDDAKLARSPTPWRIRKRAPRSIGLERLGLGGANREAEGLASTVGVDGDGNYHRDRDDPACLAQLHRGSVAATRNGRIIGPRLQSLSRIPTPI